MMRRTFFTLVSALLLVSFCFGLSACGFLNTLRLPPLSEQNGAPVQQSSLPPGEAPAAQEAVIETAAEPTPEPTPTPTPEPTPEPTPALPEKPDVDITGFEFLLANSFNSIGMEYYPQYANFEGQGIDARIAEPAMAFLTAAREAGFNAWVSTAFRNSEYLNSWFLSYYNNVYNRDPIEAANHFLAQGLDEHQTGLAIDFTDQYYRSATYDIFNDPEMQDTELYAWLVEHCADYGFILRYPEDKQPFYGTPCRHPAHFRYVGEEAARYITDNDLCLEEFLLMYEGNTVFMPQP